MDVAGGEVDLEAGDAGQGAGWGADLGGEVGHGADVVAEERRGMGKLRAHQLHAVTGIAAKAYGYGFAFLEGNRAPVGTFECTSRCHESGPPTCGGVVSS